MKKIIFIFFLLFGIGLNSFANTLISFHHNEPTGMRPIRIRINFDIAAPRLACESGFGFCNPSGGFGRSKGSRAVNAECYIEEGVFVLEIQREKINPGLEQELESESFFTITDEFELPTEWLNEMKIDDAFLIPIGEYKINDLKDSFLINFQLK